MGKTTKRHGLKSFASKLILFVMAILVVEAVCLSVMGMLFLRKSMRESIDNYEETCDEGYRTEIKSEVQSAITVVEGYYNQVKSGAMKEADAKKAAAEAIRNMRYRDDLSGYMWIDDTNYTLVMHPILPEQEGNNRYELQDQNGVMIIQNIMKSAQAGGGYNEFYFTKADGVTVAPKVAYSEMFEPWNWVITTGNYVDDMQEEMKTQEEAIRKSFYNMLGAFVIISLLIVGAGIAVIAVFGMTVAKSIKVVDGHLQKIAGGDLTFEIDHRLLERNDEIGGIANSLTSAKTAFSNMIAEIKNGSGELKEDSAEFSTKFEDITESIKNINTAVEELAQGATNQANETETVNGKVIELADIIQTEKNGVTKLGQSVSSMMKHSDKAVESINELYHITETTIGAIDVVSDQTAKNNESAISINKAVEIIKGIAEQTNLLSLNASIEAARAGESGRGFAVVAEEIRNLAEESAKSAEEIELVVRELLYNVENSVTKMAEVSEEVKEQKIRLDDTKESFDSLYQEIKTVEDMTVEIDHQTKVLDDIRVVVSEATTGLASVIEENAASMQETSASMQILSETIESCQQDTKKLAQLSEQQSDEANKFKLSM